jgi:hypothetical protein
VDLQQKKKVESQKHGQEGLIVTSMSVERWGKVEVIISLVTET